ncbi:TyrR/PhhR family helix-turn-helix DNA-binding protein, partial [Klebsiella pneumoniae]|uniref:TyrR/PhhR family helix-turn-helix DNA-binding protein n=1 Tax=Klebsiella pneumoniae TaxID=573 RepID=UPI003EDFD7E1
EEKRTESSSNISQCPIARRDAKMHHPGKRIKKPVYTGLARFADEQGIPRPKLSADLSTVLTRYSWPGNVRQLKNAVYRALTQLEGFELRPQDILLPDHDVASLPVGEEAMEGSLDDITRRFERSVLTQLYRSYPSTRKLAKRLGVSHTAIANKLREYGLSQKKGDE